MSTQDYYQKKERINSIKELTNREKEVLVMELRKEYYGMDRTGANHLDTSRIKSPMQLVVNKLETSLWTR